MKSTLKVLSAFCLSEINLFQAFFSNVESVFFSDGSFFTKHNDATAQGVDSVKSRKTSAQPQTISFV